MTSIFEYSTVSSPEDQQRLKEIIAQCFLMSPSSHDSQKYFEGVGLENFRVIRSNKQIAGGLALLSMGQWWGGKCVPMTGVAAVGIAPEYRGSGAALALLQNTLRELYTNGTPISVLYPAIQRLYRKVGYEQAGFFCNWEIATDKIGLEAQSLSLSAIEATESQVFQWLYQQQAKSINGNLQRHPLNWASVFRKDAQETIHAYCFGSLEQPQGYIIFSQHRFEDNTILRIRDWSILTADAGRSCWTFLANHRSQIDKIKWVGGVNDPLNLLLPEQQAKLKSTFRWLLRIINLPLALAARGYSLGIETELHLEIYDEIIPENNGRFILTVSQGKGEVIAGGKGELKLNIRGLAPLYTGLFTPQQLQLTGHLEATENAISSASQIFAGAAPGIRDFF